LVCEVCGKRGVEYLSVGSSKKPQVRHFCRVHRQNMVEEFHKLFVAYSPNILVTSPHQEGSYAQLYPFYPVSEMKMMNFSNSDIEIVNEKLSLFGVKKCAACKEQASAVYFTTVPEMYTWNGMDMKQLQTSGGHFYCKQHCFKQIEGKLLANKNLFNDSGLVAPYGGSGIYVNTPL